MRKIFRQLAVLLVSSLALTSLAEADGPAQIGEPQRGAEVVKKYPPYPNIWSAKGIIWAFCAASDGDFYTMSPPSIRRGKSAETWEITSFFGRSTIELPSEQSEHIWRSREPLPGIGMLKCFGVPDHTTNRKYEHPPSLTLPNGVTIRVACLGGAQFGRSCEFPYFGSGIQATDQAGHIIAHKTLLYMPKKPKQRYLPSPRISEDGGQITERVIYLDPQLVALDDGTFLVKTDQGVVRFDGHISASIPHNWHDLAIVDTKALDDVYDQLFGFKGSPSTVADFQALQDVTAKFLHKLEEGMQP
ncbi:MAG: hypothetical protein IT391_06120 [Nitrospira sp.]|nr:hypothetical protein [Nitrospira sp.]